MNYLRNLAYVLGVSMLALVTLLALNGCNAGAGTGSAPTPTSGQGTVKLFVTDAATDRFNQILVTITGITLIGQDGTPRQVISTGTTTVDLRNLTDFSQFLASNGVTAGTYSTIRLEVSDIVLNQVDDNGNLVDTRTVKLPSGKIDINLRAISIADGDEQTIQIDFDAGNSFKITQTGNGKLIFRPVIFVHLIGENETGPGRLVRERGAITMLNLDAGTFSLCREDTQSTDDCLDVSFDNQTTIYDSNLTQLTAGDLVENTGVTVFGHLTRDANGTRIAAITLVMGPEGTLLTARGQVLDPPDTNGSMNIDVPAGEVVPAGETRVQLVPGAQIVSRATGEMLTTADLPAGTQVMVIGQFDTDAGSFTAIDVSVADHNDVVAGTVTAVNTVAGTGSTTLTVSTAGGNQCVHVSQEAHIAINRNGLDDAVDDGVATDVTAGQTVSAKGDMGNDLCLEADNVIANGG